MSKQAEYLNKIQIYNMLLTADQMEHDIPEGAFGKQCTNILQQYQFDLERNLAQHPSLSEEELATEVEAIEDAHLLNLLLPDVAANREFYSEDDIDDRLNDAIDECEEKAFETGFCAFLESRGYISTINNEEGQPETAFLMWKYIEDRAALQAEYGELDADADTQFKLMDQKVLLHLILEQGAEAQGIYDELAEYAPEAPREFIGRTQLRELQSDVAQLWHHGRSDYEETLTAPANDFNEKAMEKFDGARLDYPAFDAFAQQEYEQTIRGIYAMPDAPMEDVYKAIKIDRVALIGSDYMHMLGQHDLFDDDGVIDFAQFAKKKEAIDRTYIADHPGEEKETMASITLFDRAMQYQLFSVMHAGIYDAVFEQFLAQQRARGESNEPGR